MSVSSHHSFILSMTEEVSFWRFGKTCYSPNGEHVCVYNPVIQGRTFFPRFYVHMFTSRGRGAHADSSANKAGLYVVRISLGTLSDVPAKGGQDPYPPKKSGPFLFPETSFQKSNMSE